MRVGGFRRLAVGILRNLQYPLSFCSTSLIAATVKCHRVKARIAEVQEHQLQIKSSGESKVIIEVGTFVKEPLLKSRKATKALQTSLQGLHSTELLYRQSHQFFPGSRPHTQQLRRSSVPIFGHDYPESKALIWA